VKFRCRSSSCDLDDIAAGSVAAANSDSAARYVSCSEPDWVPAAAFRSIAVQLARLGSTAC
jgi:hypothetical protein